MDFKLFLRQGRDDMAKDIIDATLNVRAFTVARGDGLISVSD